MSTFVNNDVASGAIVYASDHNTQGALLAAVLNGGLDNANISASAAIAGSKLADDSVTDTQLDYPRWWQEIGRTTVASGDSATVSIPGRKYLKIIYVCVGNGSVINGKIQFNGDTGNSYANRQSDNGAADGSQVSQPAIFADAGGTTDHFFGEINVVNIASQAKVAFGMAGGAGTSGAGNAPRRRELSAKWHNTSDQITSVRLFNDGAGDYATGTEIVVLGHD